MGEPVRVPVDAVCALPEGAACQAAITFGVRTVGGAWRMGSAAAAAGLGFDLTGPTGRALAGSSGTARTGVVEFYTSAAGGGSVASLPAGGRWRPLRFYVVTSLRVVAVPRPSESRRGQTVLALPWGTGPGKAGLLPGNESPTEGPSSFDVDVSGRIYLLDGLQRRLAVFDRGRLVREAALDAAAIPWDAAVRRDGTAFVLSRDGEGLVSTQLSPGGSVRAVRRLGEAIPDRIRVATGQAFAHLLPMDAWVPVDDPSAMPLIGQPAGDGSALLSVVRGSAVRLGTVAAGSVADPLELRFDHQVGELSLAAPDGRGGYVAVVRFVSGTGAIRGYQVIRAGANGSLGTFAVRAVEFAEAATLSRFCVGVDGSLY